MGELYALGTAVCFSLVAVFVRKGLRPGERENGVLIALTCNVGMLGVVVALRLATAASDFALTGAAAGGFAAAGVLTNCLGRAAHFHGIRHMGPSRSSAIKNLHPLVTVALALVVLGERLPMISYVGSAVALIGYWFLVKERLRAPAPALALDGGRHPTAESSSIKKNRRGPISGPRPTTGYLITTLSAVALGAGHTVRKAAIDAQPDPYLGAFVAALAGHSCVCRVHGVSRNFNARSEKRHVVRPPQLLASRSCIHRWSVVVLLGPHVHPGN